MLTAVGEAVVAGLVGSLIFFLANLFFGGTAHSAQVASFYGFWVFAIGAFVMGLRQSR
jgi:hypothetical protein